jgi:hypothetical protein
MAITKKSLVGSGSATKSNPANRAKSVSPAGSQKQAGKKLVAAKVVAPKMFGPG